jgi:acyl dehydratase
MSTSYFPDHIEISCGPVSAVDLSLYAAASGDLNPLHLDEGIAKNSGFDKPLVHGMLTMAYAGRLFTNNFGADSLVSISTRFIGAAKRGDLITLSAKLMESDHGTAAYELTGHTDSGVEIVSGSAVIRSK